MNGVLGNALDDPSQFAIEDVSLDPMKPHRYATFINERLLEGIRVLEVREKWGWLGCVRDSNRSIPQLFSDHGLDELTRDIEEGALAVSRLACLLSPFCYSFLCGVMTTTIKKQTISKRSFLAPFIKHIIRENLKVRLDGGFQLS